MNGLPNFLPKHTALYKIQFPTAKIPDPAEKVMPQTAPNRVGIEVTRRKL